MQQENSSHRISRELRWLREQDDCLTLEYIASCSGVPQSTVHRAIQGNVRLQRRTVSKLVEFIDKETKGEISTHYLLNANGLSAEVSRKGKNCEHMDQDYSGLNLFSSDHSKSVFTRCNFSRANLTRAIFRGANFVNCTFDDAQMLGADLSRATFEGCTFFRADGSMSKWIDAYITESNFRDFIHTGINFTRLKTGTHVRWLSDSYKGGFIGKDADFSGFCWFPHTHAFASELFLQNAANRPEWKMLAGGVDINARGAEMCWLGFIWYTNTRFSHSEREEIWSVLLQNPAWGFNWHLKLERDIKYPFLIDLYGENYPDWPALLTLYAQLENHEFQLEGVQYKFTRLAHAVPVDTCSPEKEKQLFLKPRTLKCRLEEILFEQFQAGIIN